MVKLSYLLKPRWELFRRHDLRLRTDPDPVGARELFKKRLAEAKRWQKIRLACFIGIYFSAIVTSVGAIIAIFWNVVWLENALGAIGGVVSSLALLFIAGAFLATRVLSYIEVDLYFYSDESRQSRREPSEPDAPAENEEKPATNGRNRNHRAKRRVYTRPPLSSYRP